MNHIPAPEKEGFVCIGAIIGAHGIKGQVKVKSFCEVPSDIISYGPLIGDGGEAFTLKDPRPGPRGVLIARIEGIGDRTKAETLTGTNLYVAQEKLTQAAGPDALPYAVLKGMRAEFANGTVFGTVTDVFDGGAQTILAIDHNGEEVLIPLVEDIVLHAEPAARRLIVSERVQEFVGLAE